MDGKPHVKDLEEEELRRNYDFWTTTVPASPKYKLEAGFEDALRQVPTTHSFGARSGGILKLDEKVLFEDKALLANTERRRALASVGAGTVGSTAARWGLDEFVFTYLGVHDPYYARTHFPAFGVFVKRGAETFPRCNATRRDLASPETGGDDDATVRLQFLLPSDARDLPSDTRELASLELGNDDRHQGSFRRYWGFPEFWADAGYATDSWKWKHEFHFLEQIPTTNFDAILWPREMRVNAWTRGFVPAPLTDRQSEFMDAHKQCAVISYSPSTHYPASAFVSASARVAEHYVRTGSFPTFIGTAP